jgi:hypothetical protein
MPGNKGSLAQWTTALVLLLHVVMGSILAHVLFLSSDSKVPGIRLVFGCPVCLLTYKFSRIPGIPVVKIDPELIVLVTITATKKKTGFRKFRSDSGLQPGICPESTRNRWGSVKTSSVKLKEPPYLS